MIIVNIAWFMNEFSETVYYGLINVREIQLCCCCVVV